MPWWSLTKSWPVPWATRRKRRRLWQRGAALWHSQPGSPPSSFCQCCAPAAVFTAVGRFSFSRPYPFCAAALTALPRCACIFFGTAKVLWHHRPFGGSACDKGPGPGKSRGRAFLHSCMRALRQKSGGLGIQRLHGGRLVVSGQRLADGESILLQHLCQVPVASAAQTAAGRAAQRTRAAGCPAHKCSSSSQFSTRPALCAPYIKRAPERQGPPTSLLSGGGYECCPSSRWRRARRSATQGCCSAYEAPSPSFFSRPPQSPARCPDTRISPRGNPAQSRPACCPTGRCRGRNARIPPAPARGIFSSMSSALSVRGISKKAHHFLHSKRRPAKARGRRICYSAFSSDIKMP